MRPPGDRARGSAAAAALLRDGATPRLFLQLVYAARGRDALLSSGWPLALLSRSERSSTSDLGHNLRRFAGYRDDVPRALVARGDLGCEYRWFFLFPTRTNVSPALLRDGAAHGN